MQLIKWVFVHFTFYSSLYELINLNKLHVKIVILYIHRIAKALNSCNASTSDIVDTTERLKQELEITTQRQDIVSCFLRDYQLSSDEVYTYS